VALPRGGVPVAGEIARELGLPLDVFVVRKLGMPGHEEYAMGAIASGGIRVTNPETAALQIAPDAIEAVARVEQRELERREKLYRGARPPLDARGRTVILVDDGLATGASMRAAVLAMRRLAPARIVVAVPVGAPTRASRCARGRRGRVREGAAPVRRRRGVVRRFPPDRRRRRARRARRRLARRGGARRLDAMDALAAVRRSAVPLEGDLDAVVRVAGD
jgi:adenine/guanine phosphoribosyltransferase-like PRPP-binding protein